TRQRCKVDGCNVASRNSPQELPLSVFERRGRSVATLALFAFALLALLALLARPALADTPAAGRTSQADASPTTIAGRYSPYEQASIDQALAKLGRELDPAPEGKTVEGIDVVTLDVIEPRDPAPNALN